MEKGVYTMTKKEAIEYLQKNKPTSGFEGLAEAVDMAIESLQEDIYVEPDDTETQPVLYYVNDGK